MELVSSSSFAAFTSFAAVLDVDYPGKGKTQNHKDTDLQLKGKPTVTRTQIYN